MSFEMRQVVFTFLTEMRSQHTGKTNWSRKELLDFSNSLGFASIPTWILNDKSRRSSKRGEYLFPEMENDCSTLDIVKVVKDGRGRPRKNKNMVQQDSSVLV